ncbi:hypothetical protein DFH06DRAFT_1338121 [Mycena polygramma]|nr:hypothetical protein DFH06DRAFT_1338121 [Mycena polygramma]
MFHASDISLAISKQLAQISTFISITILLKRRLRCLYCQHTGALVAVAPSTAAPSVPGVCTHLQSIVFWFVTVCEHGLLTPLHNLASSLDKIQAEAQSRPTETVSVDDLALNFAIPEYYIELRPGVFSTDRPVLLLENSDEDWTVEALNEALKADYGFNAVEILLEHDAATVCHLRSRVVSPWYYLGSRGLNSLLTVMREVSLTPTPTWRNIKLPEYTSKRIVWEKLRIAIQEGIALLNA